MADSTFADPFPPNPNSSADYDPTSSDAFLFDNLDFNFDDLDFTFEDLCLPSSDWIPDFPNSASPKSPGERSSDVASVSLNRTSPESETGSASSQGSDNSVKRKKESGDVNPDSRSSQEEEKRKKARLMRNRESAQLSRQRKKHYVEELEEKVRSMHSTIQDMNTKISYIMAENASLRKQLSGVPIYPSMGYPWMMCPPYASSRVPIPRLKSKKPSPASKAKGNKTKKVASVSFLGLLFFILLFGGLVPIVNLKFGGEMRDIDVGNSRFYETQTQNVRKGLGGGNNFTSNIIIHCGRGHNGVDKSNVVRPGNSSEPLVASLYVPRNDKLVKIDGNLIIHSVMASDKSMASRKDGASTVGGRNIPPAIPLKGRNNGRHQQHVYGSASADKDSLRSTAADGKLQQWFREGLAGPMLSSGMCTEVFQFDVSPAPAAIVPATSVMNVSAGQRATHLVKGRNRRILHGAPIPLLGSQNNITKEHVGRNPVKDNFRGNNSLSSMVVSVLFDPWDAGDIDINGKMRPKSLSRIFVVLLIDSVKYVTYSCMLPLKGSGAPLVTM